MATNTKNFNFKKPDESDFYSIQDQNGNWDLADEELQKLNEPAFEDYTTGTSVPPAATALEALKSKIKLPVWMSNVVAFCKGCCTLAMIVNNCVSSDADKPLAAAQGKVLQDQLTKLYSDIGISQGLFTDVADIVSDSNLYYAKIGPHLIYITGWLEIATGNYDASYQVFKMDEYKAKINTILHAVDANALTSPVFPMYINNSTNIVNLKLNQDINNALTLQITGFIVV